MSELPTVLSLGDARAREPWLCGGKASRLAELRAAGHAVPDGFVLTTAAFDGGALRDDARAALAEALAGLVGPFAVRSSGVAEDLADASFAGQYETVLDVDGVAAVTEAVGRCLTSAAADRVRAYREARGVEGAPMAVLVQRFVRASAAGVAFTAHPVTGERDVVVVSAVAGGGEALVSGASDAEEWEVREVAVRRRSATEEALSAEEAALVARLARSVAGAIPTDVEWALTREGGTPTLHLLQARPMTAVPDVVSWDAPAEGAFIRNFRLGEWIGAPVTPLFETWILTDLEEQLHQHFLRLTALATPRPLHVIVHGWYFYGGMNFELSFWALLRALPRMLWTLAGPRRAELLAATPPLAHLGFETELSRWRETLLPAFRAVVAAAASEVEAARPERLLGLVQAIVDATATQLCSIVGVAGYAAKVEGRLIELCKTHLPNHDGSVVELVSGAEVTPAPHDVEGLDPIFPTLGEVRSLAAPPTQETRARVRARRDEAEARALAACPEPQRRRLRALVVEARRAHQARLDQTGVLTLGWPTLRRALLRLGEEVATRGVMGTREDVFFLTRAELEGALRGETETVDVAERRATWERQRRLAPPLLIGTPTAFFAKVLGTIQGLVHHAEHDAEDAIPGMPGSPGRVSGPARVIRSVGELHRLLPGEILVAPVTTPMWTLAFGRAAAIVTDTGSVASHASIVAREHGIPAVVGTGTATSRIADGQRITVDGGRGVVRLGAPA